MYHLTIPLLGIIFYLRIMYTLDVIYLVCNLSQLPDEGNKIGRNMLQCLN